MKNTVLTFAFLFTLFFACAQTPFFAKAKVLEDYEYLYSSLKDAHYNVYAYTSEKELEATYQKVKAQINKDSLSLLETVNIFQQLTAAVKNGHTNIDFPGQSYMAYAETGGTVFPLEVAFENNRPLIRKNWSDDSSILIGSELISINDTPMGEVLSKIHPLIAAERPYFKNVKLELYSLPRYYWQVYGQQDRFQVTVKTKGSITKHTLNAIPLIEGYEMKRDEILNARMQLKFHGESAYINPGNFSGDEEKYQQFIDSSFVEINKRKSKNLIVDLRNNGGGDDSFSDYLVSYFADKPFKWNSKFTLKTSAFLKQHVKQHYDTTNPFWKEALTHKNGEVYQYGFDAYSPKPAEKRFEGSVYVLVNRQSHSQSAVTAAQIQDYQFGTIVGEETGDYPSLYASIFQYQLPHTGISVNVSKGYMVRVNGSKKEEGVQPDIAIKDYLLDENDEILDELLAKLQSK